MSPASSGSTTARPRSRRLWVAIALAAILVVAGGLVALHLATPAPKAASHNGVIQVVASENFWGSLISQLGGAHVSVLSIVSDPNADPHEYESNTSDALAISSAQLVIENGAGYDAWCSQIVSADANSHQVVLNVANVLGKVAGDNPHFWYGQAYVNATLLAMFSALVTIDPADAGYFQQQYGALNASLTADVWAREAEIRAHWAATQVASTESIFVYMANSTNLDLVSPPAFMDAVAEGNDPPTSSVLLFQTQLESGNVSVMVYNQQTVTPLTDSMKAIATSHNVSVVAVTETIQPPNVPFQVWMESELLSLENALNQQALGK